MTRLDLLWGGMLFGGAVHGNRWLCLGLSFVDEVTGGWLLVARGPKCGVDQDANQRERTR